MKNCILFLFLFVSTSIFAQEDTIYKKVFDNVEKECDSLSNNSLSDIRLCYLNEFKYVINQNIVEELEKENILSDYLGKSIYLEVEVDSIGKFRILKTKTKSSKIDKIISELISKLPAIKPFKNITHSNENLNAILDFKLKKIKNIYKNNEKGGRNESDKTIKESLIIPNFSDCKDINDKELIKKYFDESLKNHIIKNFTYPSIAKNRGIDGKTINYFIINKNGGTEQYISFGADILLLKESLRIIKNYQNLFLEK